ncbi:MAG: hypothetical protein AB8H79_22375 [Myxococcota bacterium]
MSDIPEESPPLHRRPWTERRVIGVVPAPGDSTSVMESVQDGANAVIDTAKTTFAEATKLSLNATTAAAKATAAGGTTAALLAAKAGGEGAAAAAVSSTAASAASAALGAVSGATTAVGGALSAAAAGAGAAATGAAGSVTALAAATLGAAVAAPAIPAVLAVGAVGAAGFALWRYFGSNTATALTEVTGAECAGLQFPPGHPRDGLVYAVHPIHHQKYFILNQFHHALFDEKKAELLALLQGLRAAEVAVEWVAGHRDARAFSGPHATETDPVVSFRAKPGSISAPKGLHWLAHEPEWLELVRQREEGKNPTFEVDLVWEDDLGLGQAAVDALTAAGWDLGGDGGSFTPTRWRLRGTWQ